MKTETLKVEMNQPVVMVDGYHTKPRRGEVVKVGRVWIDVRPEGSKGTFTNRYRLDTQTDGSDIGTPGRFYTLEQWAERERQAAADVVLRDQGIRLDYTSLWRGREVELANLLKNAAKPEEEQ